MRLALSLLLFLAFSGLVRSEAPSPAVHMKEPREFAYFVGDVVTRSAEFAVAPGEELVPASLPQRGQLNYWLELRDVSHGEPTRAGASRRTLELSYQLFYVPLDTRRLKIPAMNVEIKGPAGSRVATIPAFELLISPIRETFPDKSGETANTFLKADAAAEREPTGWARTSALASAIASALALLALAHHRAWFPFHARPGRPFTEATRKVSDHRQTYASALIALHRAFDQSGGERLLASDVDRFFASRPEQSGARTAIEQFFTASQTLFFAGDDIAAEAGMPRSALEALAEVLAANERTAR